MILYISQDEEKMFKDILVKRIKNKNKNKKTLVAGLTTTEARRQRCSISNGWDKIEWCGQSQAC